MSIGRSTIHYWVRGTRDPLAESVTEIIAALQTIDEKAAKDFVRLYLGSIAELGDRDS